MKKEKRTIMIVEDSIVAVAHLTSILSKYVIHTFSSGMDALNSVKSINPDLILLDLNLTPNTSNIQMNGHEVIKKLKKDHETKDIPIICITGELDTTKEIHALELGAIDYIRKPYNNIIVKLRVESQMKLLEKNEEIKMLNTTDKLTNLPNRHCFDERIEVEWHRTERNKENLSMLMIDVDCFKEYNDTYGHLQGDKALKYTGKIIKNSLTRKVDYVARWGGEEFIVLLSQVSYNGTLVIAERIRKNVERAFVLTKSGDKTKITVSIGAFLCKSPKHDLTKDQFITNADNALYQAKRTGKNKVIMLTNE